jgi:hypothetical protein
LSKRVRQCEGLFWRWLELDLHGELHRKTVARSILDATTKGEALLPALNGGVSAPKNR